MHMHAIGAGGVAGVLVLFACGESLPNDEAPADAGVDRAVAFDASLADAPLDAPADVVADGCTSAPCNVDVVASLRPRAIAASADVFAWLEGDEVRRPNPDGGQSLLVMPIDAGATGFMAVDGLEVLATQDVGPRGCNVSMAPCFDPSSPIYGLASAGAFVSVSQDVFATEQTGARRLVYCGPGGCGNAPATVAYLPAIAKRIVLTATSVVVALDDDTIRTYLRSARDLDASSPLATANDVQGLAVDGATVFWTSGAAGTIARCTVGACATPETILSGRAYPRAIAKSGEFLYWVETNADAIFRCTLPACTDAAVVARARQPIDMAIGDRVYVVSESEQKIYAVR